ncbi:hypothetical protein D8M35_02255 [Curtobacterium sp. HSID17257]|nr:hypothetical protein D8M35_02255 [Curtobacterium sp. HSID17257]
MPWAAISLALVLLALFLTVGAVWLVAQSNSLGRVLLAADMTLGFAKVRVPAALDGVPSDR